MKKIIILIVFCLNFVLMQGAVFSQEQDIYFMAYITRIENKIKTNWSQPEGQADKKVVTLLTINKNGNLLGSHISKSSGNEEFDKSALKAISQSAPFEHFPKSNNSEKMIMQLTFNKYNFESKEVFDDFNSNQNTQNSVENNTLELRPKNELVIRKDSTEISDTNKSSNDPKFKPYINNLQRKIKFDWSPTKSSQSKKVVTFLKIQKDGTLSESKIVESSGDQNYDQSALLAIYKAAPFESLPKDFQGNSIDVQFTFNYNVFENKEKVSPNENYKTTTDYVFYKKQVETILSYHLPHGLYFKEKYLMLNIDINKNGQIESIEKQASSGDITYDNKAIASLKKSSFPPIPDSLNVSDFKLNYMVKVQKQNTKYIYTQPETPLTSSFHLITSMLNFSSALILLHCIH